MSYKDVSFWTKISHTIQLFGTGGQVALVASDASHIWNYITAGATIAGMILAVWMDDKNNNGTVDIFEKEVTTVTSIKSDSPIIVETEVTEVKKPTS